MCEKYAKNIVFKLNPFIQNKSFQMLTFYMIFHVKIMFISPWILINIILMKI